MVRQIERAGKPGVPYAGEPLEEWRVAAIGPGWKPVAGEPELWPVDGRLAVHPEGLVFRADDASDRATGEPVVEVIPAGSVLDAGPLSPGSRITPSELAGLWMPRLLRRFRSPGFVVRTSTGPWMFDCPHGPRRAQVVGGRYVPGGER